MNNVISDHGDERPPTVTRDHGDEMIMFKTLFSSTLISLSFFVP